MIICPNGFWLTGKPRDILLLLAELATQHTYVSEVISSRLQY